MALDGTCLITTCTNRKRIALPPPLSAFSLPSTSQRLLLEEWCSRLSEHRPAGRASDVYCGRGFREASMARDEVSGQLWVISAGLGFIADHAWIPSYSLTLSGSGPNSIRRKVTESSFSPTTWWEGITAHQGLTNPIHQLVLSNSSKLFVFALSQSYAALVQNDILMLPEEHLGRVRLIGLAIGPVLDPKLQKLVMPYDERFNGSCGINAGTRSDFAQRAMRHFVTIVLMSAKSNTLEEHSKLVNQAISGNSLPQVPRRKRLSDKEIMAIILNRLDSHRAGSSHMLRLLRDQENVACEQGRFKKLYKIAKEKWLNDLR